MDSCYTIAFLALVAVWLSYKKLTQNFNVFEERNVAYEKPIVLFGNMLDVLLGKTSFFDYQDKLYQKFYNKKIFGFFIFGTPTFVVKDAELIKQLSIKDFDNFVNHDKFFDESIDKIGGRNLFSLTDERWKTMRNSLSPLFTSSKMKMMFDLVSECAQDFVKHFEKKSANGKVIIDAKDVFARYTVDGISTAAFGFKGDCIENEDSSLFKLALSTNTADFAATVKFILMSMSKPLYKLLGLQFLTREFHDFLKRVITDSMAERESKGIFRSDLIQLLLQVKNGKLDKSEKNDEKDLKNFSANIEYDLKPKDRKINWTKEDFMAQGFVFFAAGFDTTKHLLQTLSYELAKNRNVQDELIEEVDEVVSNLEEGKTISYETLHKMKFLDQVISESLRMWTPGNGATNRECSKDYKIYLENGETVDIKVGDQIIFPVQDIHMDPKYFENPSKFDPHRFDDDRKSSIVSGSYFPFGSGPRVCIGSRFALMEAKLLIFNILTKFTIEFCDATPRKLEYATKFRALEFKNDIVLELKPRN